MCSLLRLPIHIHELSPSVLVFVWFFLLSLLFSLLLFFVSFVVTGGGVLEGRGHHSIMTLDNRSRNRMITHKVKQCTHAPTHTW